MLGILETIIPSELVSNGYISNHNKVQRPRPKFKVSFYLYFCCFWINITQINFENTKRKYKESFLIVVSSWNCDLMLMLERPLSHYWTSPLSFGTVLVIEIVSLVSSHSHSKHLHWGNFKLPFPMETFPPPPQKKKKKKKKWKEKRRLN